MLWSRWFQIDKSTALTNHPAAGATNEGWAGGLGRLLAEAVEGVGGGKKEGAAAAHANPNVQRADELLRKVGCSDRSSARDDRSNMILTVPYTQHQAARRPKLPRIVQAAEGGLRHK